MNARNHLFEAALLFAVAAAADSALAAESAAAPDSLVFDCARPTLPSQREVGELLGETNFSQVYDSRARLMAEARRDCRRSGARRVRLVLERPADERPQADDRRVADGARRGESR